MKYILYVLAKRLKTYLEVQKPDCILTETFLYFGLNNYWRKIAQFFFQSKPQTNAVSIESHYTFILSLCNNTRVNFIILMQ